MEGNCYFDGKTDNNLINGGNTTMLMMTTTLIRTDIDNDTKSRTQRSQFDLISGNDDDDDDVTKRKRVSLSVTDC